MHKAKRKNINAAARHISRLIRQNEPITFFLGAGISVARPSLAPDWRHLRNGLVTALLGRLTEANYVSDACAQRLLGDFISFESRHNLWLKPEVALQWLHSRFGNTLFDALTVLDQGKPNLNHAVLARVVVRNSSSLLLTTNFDLYLEQAFEELDTPCQVYAAVHRTGKTLSYRDYLRDTTTHPHQNSQSLVKFHGTLGEPKTLRATLRQVARSLSPSGRRILETSIRNRHVIVIGYSGNDYDLFPVFQASAGEALSLLWLARDLTSVTKDVVDLRGEHSIYYGDLNAFFSSLCGVVGIRPSTKYRKYSGSFDPSYMSRNLSCWAAGLDPTETAYTLALLGMHVGMFEFCETLCKTLRRRKKQIGIFYPRTLNVLGIVFRRRDPKKAMRCFRQAEKEAKPVRQNNPILYGNILGNLAALYLELARHKDALKALTRSTYWARRGNSRELITSNYDDRGNIERISGRPAKALKYHLMAEKGRRADGDLIGLGVTLNNQGLTYAELGKLDRAAECLKESVRLRRKETGHTTGLARSLLNLGEVQIQQVKYRSAIRSLHETLTLSTRIEDHVLVCRSTYDIAEICARCGHMRWGHNLFLKAEKLSVSIPSWCRDSYRMEWIEPIRNRFT